MKKLLVANWKMHPSSVAEAVQLAKASDAEDVWIAPPFPFLSQVGDVLVQGAQGAQDLFQENPNNGGAYTGAVSAAMLKSLGVTFVIIGHSERRAYFFETDTEIAKKVLCACESGITPVLCVGESVEVRKGGIAHAAAFVEQQLAKDLSLLPSDAAHEMVIAYEPVWAIGTGDNDTPRNAADMARTIMRAVARAHPRLRVRVLYGGSVDEKNIVSFAREHDIAGFLVGGASVRADEFARMVMLVHNL